jgi:DNA ligase-1
MLPAALPSVSSRSGAVTSAANLPWLEAVPQFRVPDAEALQKKLRDIIRQNGEGALMLYCDDAAYQTGRSSALLKLTLWLDAEARVVAHLAGKGKHAGMLGALQMEMPDGRRFALGSGLTDALRRNPPPVGRARHLPLSRTYAKRHTALSEVSAGCVTECDQLRMSANL